VALGNLQKKFPRDARWSAGCADYHAEHTRVQMGTLGGMSIKNKVRRRAEGRAFRPLRRGSLALRGVAAGG
jgi:hypothetical protein